MFFVDIPCCPYACCDRLCGLASAFGFASFVEQEVIRTQSQVIVGVLKLALKRVKRRVKNSGRRQAESCRYVYTIGCLPHQEEANVAPRMLLGASQVRGLGAWKKPGDFLAKKKNHRPNWADGFFKSQALFNEQLAVFFCWKWWRWRESNPRPSCFLTWHLHA